MQGPEVRFSEPTEWFIVDGSGNRKFRAYELNEQTGLYIKVIADYEDTVEVLSPDQSTEETSNERQDVQDSSDELFIHNKTCRSTSRVPNMQSFATTKTKHHAIAIPIQSSYHVLDRESNQYQTPAGKTVHVFARSTQKIIVRRILSDYECGLYYPNNQECRIQSQPSQPASQQTANYKNEMSTKLTIYQQQYATDVCQLIIAKRHGGLSAISYQPYRRL